MKVNGQLHAPAYLQENRPQYPLDRRLSGPQSRSGHDGGEKNIPAPDGNRTPVIQPVA